MRNPHGMASLKEHLLTDKEKHGLPASSEQGQAAASGSPPTPSARPPQPAKKQVRASQKPVVAGEHRPGGPPGSRAVSNARALRYGLLCLLTSSMALLRLAAPQLVASRMFGSAADPLDAQHTHLLELLGGGLLASAGAAAALALATQAGGGFGRWGTVLLWLGLASTGTGNLLTLLYCAPAFLPRLLPLRLSSNALLLALPAADLLVSGDLRGVSTELRNWLFSPPSETLLSASHLAVAMLFFCGSGLPFFIAPKFTSYRFFRYAYGSSTFALWRMAGVAALTLMPCIHLALKVATEHGTLRQPAVRTLSLGMVLAGLVHTTKLVPLLAGGHGGWLMAVNASTWAVSLLASAACLFNKDAANAGVGVGAAKKGG